MSITEKVNLFTKFRENKTDAIDESKNDQKEESKGDIHDIKEEGKQPEEALEASPTQAFKLQHSDLFGLKDDETLNNKLSSILIKGKVDNLITKDGTNLGDLYRSAYSCFKDKLEVDFYETLSAMYKHLCINAALSMMLHLPLSNVLDLIAESNQSSELLTKYMNVLSRQDNTESTSESSKFDSLVRRVLESSKSDSKYDRIVEIIMDQILIKASVETIKKGLETKQHVLGELINNEKEVTQTLDLHILPTVINNILETKPELIYGNKDNFLALLNMLLLAAITFYDEGDIKRFLVISVYRVIRPIAEDPSSYSIEIRSALLSCELLEKVMALTKDRLDENLSKQVGGTKKILIEIFMLIFKIEENSECSSIYSYPPGLLELEMRKTILTEMKDFKTIAYLKLISSLTEAEKNKSDLQETFPKMYKGNYSAKLNFIGAKKMIVNVHKDSNLDENSSILFSADPEGTDIIKTISMSSIEKSDTTVNCFSNKVYVHYPIRPPKILAWGEKNENKLGINSSAGSTSEPCVLPGLAKNFNQFCS